MEWTKSNASAAKRFFESPTGEALMKELIRRKPRLATALTTEHAAILGAMKEGRETVIEDINSLCEWEDPISDEGQEQQTT
jgi:hypothetical protein